MRKEETLTHSTNISCLLCARHCSRAGGCRVHQIDPGPASVNWGSGSQGSQSPGDLLEHRSLGTTPTPPAKVLTQLLWGGA